MLRFGLCCLFRDAPIRFVTTTATAMARLERPAALHRLAALCLANAKTLLEALRYCHDHRIGSFRINSQILPLKTHPTAGYDLVELPDSAAIKAQFQACGTFAKTHNLRTSFHPDQFVVLNSQRPDVVAASLREIEYQAELAEMVGADVINIHAGGAFGNKPAALAALTQGIDRLSPRARQRLTLENDDRLYTVADLLPVCHATGVPLVYDVHHHRCHGDGLSVEAATELSAATWNRELLVHISSPLGGWNSPHPQHHHDFIDLQDFPPEWRKLTLTVEVEAKAKELAVAQLMRELQN